MPVMPCWVVFFLCVNHLHFVPSGNLCECWTECVHRVRSWHVLGSNWSNRILNLPVMLGWVIFFVAVWCNRMHSLRIRYLQDS